MARIRPAVFVATVVLLAVEVTGCSEPAAAPTPVNRQVVLEFDGSVSTRPAAPGSSSPTRPPTRA